MKIRKKYKKQKEKKERQINESSTDLKKLDDLLENVTDIGFKTMIETVTLAFVAQKNILSVLENTYYKKTKEAYEDLNAMIYVTKKMPLEEFSEKDIKKYEELILISKTTFSKAIKDYANQETVFFQDFDRIEYSLEKIEDFVKNNVKSEKGYKEMIDKLRNVNR